MQDGQSVANDVVELQLDADGAAELRWRQAHEVRSLLDMLDTYRRCVADLAAENTRLLEEVTLLRAIADSSMSAVRTLR
jgi:hypothetical protein